MTQPEPAIGQIYHWFPGEEDLFLAVAVHREVQTWCDWVKIRGVAHVGTYIDRERVDNAKLFTGELTDAEHALCMSILLDVDGYIREQKA